MSISSFALRLFETGTADAAPWDGQLGISSELEAVIRRAHSLAGAEAPFQCPELDLDAAAWGLNVLAWGCSVFADRTEVNTELPKALIDLEPKGNSPSEHWSTDLGFRFYYSLVVRCKQIGPYDTLVEKTRRNW